MHIQFLGTLRDRCAQTLRMDGFDRLVNKKHEAHPGASQRAGASRSVGDARRPGRLRRWPRGPHQRPVLGAGAELSRDGNSGLVHVGRLEVVEERPTEQLLEIRRWRERALGAGSTAPPDVYLRGLAWIRYPFVAFGVSLSWQTASDGPCLSTSESDWLSGA